MRLQQVKTGWQAALRFPVAFEFMADSVQKHRDVGQPKPDQSERAGCEATLALLVCKIASAGSALPKFQIYSKSHILQNTTHSLEATANTAPSLIH